jgi:hypothetical protein
MITVGLSQHEINLITKVLDEHKVQYHVDAAGGSENAHEAKVKGGRGDTSFYQIEIHDGQFEMLPASAKSKLEGLGIYPEMEAPDFSEEAPKEKKTIDPVKAKKTLKTFERVFIAAMLLGIAAFIKKVMGH